MPATATSDIKLRQAFEDHFDAVSRYCLRRLNPEDAREAVAQVFVVAWRKIDEMPGDGATLPWLYRIAFYEVGTIRRTTRRLIALRTRLNGQARPDNPGPEAIVVSNAERSAVIDALSTLSDTDREVILLRSFEELTIPEIAVATNCSEAAARKRVDRAFARLAKAAGLTAAGSEVEISHSRRARQ